MPCYRGRPAFRRAMEGRHWAGFLRLVGCCGIDWKFLNVRSWAQNGPSKFCGEGLMLRAERTWRGRYLRVTRVTPLIFLPRLPKKDVAGCPPGGGAPQVHSGLGRAFARNYVRRNSLEYSGLRGEGSIPGPLPPPSSGRL